MTVYELDTQTLERALILTADHLHQRNAEVTVVAVGGAVNTLYLRSRQTTHDIDIFGSMLDQSSRYLLDEATQHAIRESPSQLGTHWLNTETQMWMSPDLQRQLTDQAVSQNVVVFSRPGLRVLAAPWEYAFSAKVSRLLTGGVQIRPYDRSDAVHYMHQIISRRGGQPGSIQTVEQWARKFHHTTDRNFLLNTINAEYRRLYGQNCIV